MCQWARPRISVRYIDDAKLIDAGFGKILVIEITETLKRGVLIDVPEHKFASSLAADTGDVNCVCLLLQYLGCNLDFGHVETQFRFLSKPLANLDQHFEGCLELGINVRIICESNPASMAVPLLTYPMGI